LVCRFAQAIGGWEIILTKSFMVCRLICLGEFTLVWKTDCQDMRVLVIFSLFLLFEAVWNIIIFLILITIIKTVKRPKPGIFFFTYLGLYGFGRFWLEFLRINPWEILGINTAQGISLGLVMIGLIGLIRRI